MKNKAVFIFLTIIIFVILVGFFWVSREEKPEPASPQEIAESWIKSSAPTYLFDGSGLRLEDIRSLDCPSCFELTYSFISASAGYGDRTKWPTAQIITPHTMRVAIEEGEITEAVTDGVFSELENTLIGKEEIEKASVYFRKRGMGEELFKVERRIRETANHTRAAKFAIDELLKGVTAEEAAEGYFSSINEGVVLQRIVVEEGVAKVDFNSRLEEGVSGSALVSSIRGQIEKTLKDFEIIDRVIISIDGRTRDILQP